jgi:two-component system sensor histidine kinase DesK
MVREAVTNLLRHSEARTVSIASYGRGPFLTFVIVNDGAGSTAAGASFSPIGLASLAARCAAAGARLAAGPVDDDRFELKVELAPNRTES